MNLLKKLVLLLCIVVFPALSAGAPIVVSTTCSPAQSDPLYVSYGCEKDEIICLHFGVFTKLVDKENITAYWPLKKHPFTVYGTCLGGKWSTKVSKKECASPAGWLLRWKCKIP